MLNIKYVETLAMPSGCDVFLYILKGSLDIQHCNLALHLSFRISSKIYGRGKLRVATSQATPLEERMQCQMLIFLVTVLLLF